jgi:homoserine dehydrogenase
MEDYMKTINLILIGFGNVGQAFARLLLKKQTDIRQLQGLDVRLVGIVTGRHGKAYNAEGLDLAACLALATQGKTLESLNRGQACKDAEEFVRTFPAHIVLETSPTHSQDGEPAITYLKAALKNGKHIITANKGPVVHAFTELQALAKAAEKKFYFEATVMDGAPLYAMLRSGFPAAQINGFSGILNSCTNLLIERMEAGESLEEAVEHAQSIGIAETDPIGDIDGWDAAIKLAALITIVMGVPTKPQQVEREGIGGLSLHHIAEAARQGKRWKLICTAERRGDEIAARVSPQMVGVDSPFYAVNGTNSFLLIHSDVLPGVGLLECEPKPDTTAYGLLADVLNIAAEEG